jgi:hypothetical protein
MFELKKSEIKRAEAAANKYLGRKDCRVTGYFSQKSPDIGAGEWYDVTCEICINNMQERAEIDVKIDAYMSDRRRSIVRVIPDHSI